MDNNSWFSGHDAGLLTADDAYDYFINKARYPHQGDASLEPHNPLLSLSRHGDSQDNWESYFELSADAAETDFIKLFPTELTQPRSSRRMQGLPASHSDLESTDSDSDESVDDQAPANRNVEPTHRRQLLEKATSDERPSKEGNEFPMTERPGLMFPGIQTAGKSSSQPPDQPNIAPSAQERLQQRPSRARLRWDAPLILNDIEILACPDTGSEQNILSKETASKLGVMGQLDLSRSSKFILGSGKDSWSLGAVELEMCFSRQPEVLLTCMFHVFETLICPAILGGVFLRRTETLTKHRQSRLRQRVEPTPSYPKVMHIGHSTERFRCYVDSVMVDTHADTGSEMDLVSNKFVQKSSQRAKALQTPMAVQFADGSFGEVSHQIFTRFSADLDRPKSKWEGKWFYILDGLPCEVLLGDETLDDLDAFNREMSFVMEVLDPDGIQLCTIFWARHFEQKASKVWDQLSDLKPGKRKTSPDAFGNQEEAISVALDDPLLANVAADFRSWLEDMIFGGDGLADPANLPDRINMSLLDALDGWETNRRSRVAIPTQQSVVENAAEAQRQQRYDTSRDVVLQALLQAAPTTPHHRRRLSASSSVDFCSDQANDAELHSPSSVLAEPPSPPAPPIRPHLCPVEGCPRGIEGRGFTRESEMIRHRLVHKSPGYKCPFCPDQPPRYPRPDNLRRHVRVHHEDIDRDDPILCDVLNRRPDGTSRGLGWRRRLLLS